MQFNSPKIETPGLIEFQPPSPMLLRWDVDTRSPQDRFDVEIFDKELNKTQKVDSQILSADISALFRSGQVNFGRTYSYKVRRWAGATWGDWSNSGQFKILPFGTPTCQEQKLEVDKTIPMGWQPLEEAPAYALQVTREPIENDAEPDPILDVRTLENSFDLQPSVNSGTIAMDESLFYRVAVASGTKKKDTLLGNWSQSYPLLVTMPKVATLEPIVVDDPIREVKLSWSKGPTASGFLVQIFDSPDPNRTPVYQSEELQTTDHDITALRDRGTLEFGKVYHYRILAHVPGLSEYLASEFQPLTIDVRSPLPMAPKGEVDGDPMPNFAWNKPQIEDCRYEVWVGQSRSTDAPWKLFVTEIGDEGLIWNAAQFAAAFRQYRESPKNRLADRLKRNQPELFEYSKQYYWRIRSIYEDQKGRRQAGLWTDWVRFVVRRSPPQVSTGEIRSQRTTPVIEWVESNWERKRPMVKQFEVEIVPESGRFSGRADDIVTILPANVVEGRNRIRLSKRLTPGVRYKWRIRTVYKRSETASDWAEAGVIALPDAPREQFPTGLLDRTEGIQEWAPALNKDFTKLAYQSGVPSENPAFADALLRSGEGSTSAGSIFLKELSHDERGMPLPDQARGTFIESWERGALITFMQPSWSNEGRLFFASNQYDTLSYLRLSIMSRAIDAPAQTSVLPAASDESILYPDVSPDGKRICFTVAKINRTKIKEIENFYTESSNDMETLEFLRQNLETDVTFEIWTSRTDGAGKTYLTRGKAGKFNYDSSKLAFLSRTRPGAPWGLWICSSRGGNLQQVVPPPATKGRISNPRWSNDGTKLAYVSNQTGNDDIWIYDLQTGKSTQITRALDDDRCPIWGKDDRYIMFVSYRAGGFDLWYVDVATL